MSYRIILYRIIYHISHIVSYHIIYIYISYIFISYIISHHKLLSAALTIEGTFSFKTAFVPPQPFLKLQKFKYAVKKGTPNGVMREVGYRLYQGEIRFNIITRGNGTNIQ